MASASESRLKFNKILKENMKVKWQFDGWKIKKEEKNLFFEKSLSEVWDITKRKCFSGELKWFKWKISHTRCQKRDRHMNGGSQLKISKKSLSRYMLFLDFFYKNLTWAYQSRKKNQKQQKLFLFNILIDRPMFLCLYTHNFFQLKTEYKTN